MRKNCIKPLVLGTSLASHTPKLSVSTAETSFCLILEPQSPLFCQPPVWDKFNPQFGTQFISISLDFHSYLLISTGQNSVQACRESLADQLLHILIMFQGLTNNEFKVKSNFILRAQHHIILCPIFSSFFVFREQSQGHYHFVCYNCVSAVIQIREL